jgi:hypothetical protein
VHVPHHSRLKWMFWHDELLRRFWDGRWGRMITGMWGVAWTEWVVIAFLWLLAWRHGGHGMHHPPGVAAMRSRAMGNQATAAMQVHNTECR